MTIAIADISMTEELGRKAVTAVRGGYSTVPAVEPVPGDYLPRVPSLPIAFPFPIRFPEFPIHLPDVCRGGDGGLKVVPL